MHQDRVSQPFRMENLDDESGGQKSGDFLSSRPTSFLIKPAKILSNWLYFGVSIKMVLSELSQYTWHVRRFPRKNVPILTDELDERAFLCRIQIGTDTELLRSISWGKVNKL